MCLAVFHQWLHEYCFLKRQLSLAWRLSTNNSPTVSAPKWPNDINSAADNAIFKNRAQKFERLFNVCVQVFCALNAKILLVYIPAKIKMSFIWTDDFFFPKIGIFCKSIAGPLSKAKRQTKTFGGRIKLIICQIRHELLKPNKNKNCILCKLLLLLLLL